MTSLSAVQEVQTEHKPARPWTASRLRSNLSQSAWSEAISDATHFVLALGMLVLTAPVILLAMLLVKLTSRGPALYSQTRLGRDGRHFTIYKIRSMVQNCERQTGAVWSQAGDARVTPLGRFLRRSHIDELPQLWNILRGNMSLVGPRPERPEFLPKLEDALPGYRNRLLHRPGLTGLAQVQLPADTDMASVRRKLAYDLYYIQNRSLGLDLRLIIATAFHVVGVPFPVLQVVLGIPDYRLVEGVETTETIEREVDSVAGSGERLSWSCA